jgi:hypothetical protein
LQTSHPAKQIPEVILSFVTFFIRTPGPVMKQFAPERMHENVKYFYRIPALLYNREQGFTTTAAAQ